MTNKLYNGLFICTGNSARSIMAEGILNKMGAGRFKAWSAGSQPKGAVHPLALEVLENLGMSQSDFRSKSWNEFAEPGAPEMNFVFTVCDNAAGEVCPVWPGQPITAHWVSMTQRRSTPARNAKSMPSTTWPRSSSVASN